MIEKKYRFAHTYSHSSPLKLRQTTSQRRTYESFIFRMIGVLALGELSIGRGIKVRCVAISGIYSSNGPNSSIQRVFGIYRISTYWEVRF